MFEWLVAACVVGVLLANIPAAIQQFRNDREGAIKTYKLIGLYLLYMAIGVGMFVGFFASEGTKGPRVYLALGVMLAWIFYGILILTRHVPRYREIPGWVARFSIADILLIALMLGCLLAYPLVPPV
ncbi:hypothetical protein A7A08_01060 [Methyloligella halotolerans]|uniref:Uncharacterized protein n=1 Tax=Methyloligella halotolerans TaxID=1177755 RepID=A0A1E2S076_9HYPH|nr:hypothetical protein [Methyloligella halotolerans]ODA67893.1 hypothetical protein A7A08_01060 [Methyloligella halotolerans]